MKKQLGTKILILLVILLYLLLVFLRYQSLGEPRKFEINLLQGLRENLDQRVSQLLPSPQAELLSGIVLGNKKDLPYDLKLALRDTSTLHIVVVSGQNLTMLGGFILGLSVLLKRKVTILISLLAIIFYTLLTGAQVPVLRAALMVSLSSLAQLFGKDRDGIWTLLVTAAAMLLFNPFWIVDLSFQLSFLATLGVVSVSPIFLRVFKKLPDILKQDLAVSLGAQLMVMPIIAQNFHQVSIVGLFANLLVLWTIPFIMILGSVLLVLSILLPIFANLAAVVVGAILSYFIYIVEFFASFSWSWVYIGELSWLVWIGYYCILVSILKFLLQRSDN